MVYFEDFFSGFLVAQITALAIGPWSLLIGLFSGIAWVAGGQGWLGTKGWRRIGVPLLVCLPFALSGHILGAVISGFGQFGVHCIGYGEPSTQPPDIGSWLGRIFGQYTRLVWFILLVITLIPLVLK